MPRLAENLAEAILHARAPLHARLRGLSAHVVLGQRLRPFCAWHVALLEVMESPFANGAALDLAALQTAVSICRSVWPHHPLARRSSLAACLLQKRFGARPKLVAELLKLAAYRRDYCSFPVFGEHRGEEARPSKCPWYLLAVTRLRLLGIPAREAWMTPLGELVWTNTAQLEERGADLSAMMDDEDIAFFTEQGVL